jgi:RimJ/RimL family protein N-acetyltransferase
MNGSYAVLDPLDPARHSEDLWQGVGGAAHDSLWRYMLNGPFAGREAFDAYLEAKAVSEDTVFYSILDQKTTTALGLATLMRIDPGNCVIEVGNIVYSSPLQKTRAATEAMYLLARYVFEALGYRRYEWKCHALNEASRRAALRLGFTFEGIFRQHMVVKGKSRDTAWFSMLDSEWPARKREFERWLDEANFDAGGNQKTALNQRI